MKYVKMLGLAAIAAAALMAFIGAGTASAATLTNGSGVHYPIGTVIHAENEGHVTLHPPFGSITCKTSTVEGTTTTTGGKNAKGETETVKGHITSLSFGDHGKSCNDGGSTVTVLQKGTLEIHSLGNGNGTLTSSGTEVTVVYLGFHCIFKTTNTDIGTVTGSSVTKSNATFDISATIPRTGGTSGAFCGATAQWTGSYRITKPNPLNID
jgi:hypothetical protein